jgi:L-lactate dehydrogenase (cytochrome)
MTGPDITVARRGLTADVGNGTAGGRRAGTVADITSRFDPSLDWDDLHQVRQWWSGPLLLKGPVGPGDALRALDAGVDGFHLSNHGGRQLDGTVAAIDLVRPVRDAVGDRAVIVMDSGVRHGADIAVALARGADMCMVGRPYLYGLAAGGPAGVRRVIDLLIEQLRRTLQLLGVASVAELRRHADQLVVDRSSLNEALLH